MTASENFDQLKRQLERMGYTGAATENALRQKVAAGEDQFSIHIKTEFEQAQLHCWFNLSRETAGGPLGIDHYDSLLWERKTQQISTRSFDADINSDKARQVLAKAIRFPWAEDDASPWILKKEAVRQYIAAENPRQINYFNELINNNMNNENLDYLKKNLLNLGFGEKLNADMEKQIQAKTPEFNLAAQQEYNGKKVDYTLHFKAGEQNDMYFFNRYDARHQEQDRAQTLYINRGHGVTAKEAFNLLEGRAVEKRLYNKENEPYQAWLKLDFKEKDERGNNKLQKFGEAYGYDLEKTLAKYPIKELNDTQQKEDLLRSLKKGNAQQVTVEQDGKNQKYYLTAVPQYKTLNVYDSNMQSVKREQLLKQDNKQEQSNKQGQTRQQDNSPKKERSHRQTTH